MQRKHIKAPEYSKKLMKHLIGILKMALIWTIFWGIIGAIIATLSGLFNISDTAWLDPWIALATLGFFGGMIFYILLQITEGDRFFIVYQSSG